MIPHLAAAAAPVYFDAVFAAFLLFIGIMLAAIVLILVSQWKLFTKAGVPGWAVLVPFYNYVKMLEISGAPLWWALMMFVPVANIVFAIRGLHRLSLVFGKGGWFTAGLLFLPFIFFPILGFGSSKYQTPAEPARMSEAVRYTLIGIFVFLLLDMSWNAGILMGQAIERVQCVFSQTYEEDEYPPADTYNPSDWNVDEWGTATPAQGR